MEQENKVISASPDVREMQLQNLTRIRQPHPGVPAKYLVYETNNPGNTLGAGMCPPNPAFASVRIPPNMSATVQAVENNIQITV
jgi:hypothetical protein